MRWLEVLDILWDFIQFVAAPYIVAQLFLWACGDKPNERLAGD